MVAAVTVNGGAGYKDILDKHSTANTEQLNTGPLNTGQLHTEDLNTGQLNI